MFLLIPPSKGNLEAYKAWISSPDQANVFFGDVADRCFKVRSSKGLKKAGTHFQSAVFLAIYRQFCSLLALALRSEIGVAAAGGGARLFEIVPWLVSA